MHYVHMYLCGRICSAQDKTFSNVPHVLCGTHDLRLVTNNKGLHQHICGNFVLAYAQRSN